jgi:hypothetical protein
MIAYVPFEAAFDGRLTPTALRLLLYLSGEHPHSRHWKGYWCWESLSEIAHNLSNQFYHYSPKMIRDARFLLRKYNYLQRTMRVILPARQGAKAVQHECFRVIVDLEDHAVATQKRA